jgi:hypothetical protein
MSRHREKKMKRPLVASLVVLAISFAVPTFAQQQKSLKELIVGTWLLESVYDQTQDGVKHNPWGDGVKGIAMYDATGHYSSQIIAADRSKTASDNPRMPVGQVNCHFGTYTVDEAAKTLTSHIERCTFPQWEGGGGTVSIAFPTEDEFQLIVTKPFPDPTLGPIAPHIIYKRAR